jgi:hypothetical protein
MLLSSGNILLICRHEILGWSLGVTILYCIDTVCEGSLTKWRENADFLISMLQIISHCSISSLAVLWLCSLVPALTILSSFCLQPDLGAAVSAALQYLGLALLFIWGYIAQILLSRQGLLTRMSEQEQNGRLQYLLHILELCAMQSTSTEFNSQAWLCAKNYSDRVYQDLDSGATSWSLGLKCIQQILCNRCHSFLRMQFHSRRRRCLSRMT